MNEYVFESIKTFIPDLECDEKYQCLEKMAEELSSSANLDKNEIYKLLKAREKFGSTALGHGFALPHTKITFIDELVCGLFITKKPIDYGSIDEIPTQIFFVLLAPSVKPSILLKALAKVAKIFKDGELKEKIMQAKNIQEAMELIKEKELSI
jgi:PTS system nitrogen regulatory IIA component